MTQPANQRIAIAAKLATSLSTRAIGERNGEERNGRVGFKKTERPDPRSGMEKDIHKQSGETQTGCNTIAY